MKQSKERTSIASLLNTPLNIYRGFTSPAADWGCQSPRLLTESIEDGHLCRGSWNALKTQACSSLVVSIALLWSTSLTASLMTFNVGRVLSRFLKCSYSFPFWALFHNQSWNWKNILIPHQRAHTPSIPVLSTDKIFQISWKTKGLSSFSIISLMENKEMNVNIKIK